MYFSDEGILSVLAKESIDGLTVALEATKQLPDTNLEEFYKS
ncbi:hypothetical protein [Paenibacillus taichungensis]|nr:hypothetical protein [Paenibacillus taichungensis]MDR9748589.1 hypothetical protein [Paenibacillus taichungensis]